MVFNIIKELEKKADKIYDIWEKSDIGIWEVIDKNIPNKSQHYKREIFKIVEIKWKRSFKNEIGYNEDLFYWRD